MSKVSSTTPSSNSSSSETPVAKSSAKEICICLIWTLKTCLFLIYFMVTTFYGLGIYGMFASGKIDYLILGFLIFGLITFFLIICAICFEHKCTLQLILIFTVANVAWQVYKVFIRGNGLGGLSKEEQGQFYSLCTYAGMIFVYLMAICIVR